MGLLGLMLRRLHLLVAVAVVVDIVVILFLLLKLFVLFVVNRLPLKNKLLNSRYSIMVI